MRNQHARVVLATCLAAAAAAAQAPSTFDGFQVADLAPGKNSGRGPNTAIGENDPPASPAASAPRSSPRFQDPVDYTQRGMFLQNHGDFLNGMERYEPMISVGGMLMPNQRISGEPGSFEVLGYNADINLPFNVSTDGYLLFGAYYEGRNYQFSGDPNPATRLNDEKLHAGGIKLGFGGFLNDNMLLEVETHPGVFSDADSGLHHKDFDFPSHALVTYRAVDHFFLKMGVRYNQIYEDANWLPYLGFSWDITGNAAAASSEAYAGAWRLDLLLPETLEVSYWSSPSTGWMWGAEVRGAEYHVRTSAASGGNDADLWIQEVISYFGLTHRMSDSFSFNGRVGAVIAGDYDLTNGTPGFNRVDGTMDQGFFADISFGFDF